MIASDFFAYTALLVSMTLAPGPLMAILVARVVARDISGALAFGLGIALGDAVIIVLIALGLGVWMQNTPEVFTVAKVLAMIYLGYIAHKMWVSTPSEPTKTDKRSGAFSAGLAGMLTCVVSPQTLLVYLLLLPQVIDINLVSTSSIGGLILLTIIALMSAFIGVILLAGRCSKLLGSTRHSKRLNRLLSASIIVSGCWMVSC